MRREDGSVTMAMSMLVVGSVAVMALLSTLLSGLNAARIDQGRAAALQQADGGIDAALYAIDAEDFADVTWITPETHFTLSDVNYEVDAQQVDEGSWTVRSIATESTTGRRRFVVATVHTEGLFPDVLFTSGALNGTGLPATISSAALGSNTSISLAVGGSAWWSGFHLYGKTSAADATAACTNCAADKVTAVPNPYTAEPLAVPETTLPCPPSGVFAGQVEPGDYLCADRDVTLASGLATVFTGNGRVRIWITNGSFTAHGGGSGINADGEPEDLQIFQSYDDGAVVPASLCGATIKAMLHLPGSSVTCPSAVPEITGAVVAATWDAPVSGLTYDDAAEDVRRGDGFTLGDWHECPIPTGDLSSPSAAWRTADC
jgi:hypothetical protein